MQTNQQIKYRAHCTDDLRKSSFFDRAIMHAVLMHNKCSTIRVEAKLIKQQRDTDKASRRRGKWNG